MAKKKNLVPFDGRFGFIQRSLDLAREAFERSDHATAAGHMYDVARWSTDLRDEMRFRQGIDAGLARAEERRRGR